jgi:predicted RNase H-like HicB family nuclease
MVLDVEPSPDAITLDSGGFVLLRPEGDWDRSGILEISATRPVRDPGENVVLILPPKNVPECWLCRIGFGGFQITGVVRARYTLEFKQEAVEHADEALALYLETFDELRKSIPEERSLKQPISLGVTVRIPVIA